MRFVLLGLRSHEGKSNAGPRSGITSAPVLIFYEHPCRSLTNIWGTGTKGSRISLLSSSVTSSGKARKSDSIAQEIEDSYTLMVACLSAGELQIAK